MSEVVATSWAGCGSWDCPTWLELAPQAETIRFSVAQSQELTRRVELQPEQVRDVIVVLQKWLATREGVA